MSNKKYLLTCIALAAGLPLMMTGCETNGSHSSHGDHLQAEHPEGDHPKGEHPEGDHPKAEHPEGDHPEGDHPTRN